VHKEKTKEDLKMLKEGCRGICNKFKKTFHTLFSARFSALIIVIWYKAFLMAFYSGSLPRIAIKTMKDMTDFQHNQQTQFMQVGVSVGAVIGGFAFGRLFPKLKNRINVIISVIVGMVCVVAVTLLFHHVAS
jgi:predicted MFS family arabinose efflux permease